MLIGISCWPETVLTPRRHRPLGRRRLRSPTTGLDHGTQFAWTYGPLGFLESPSVVAGWLTPFAIVHYLALRVGLAVSMLWALRRSLPLAAAFVLAYRGLRGDPDRGRPARPGHDLGPRVVPRRRRRGSRGC